MMEARIVQRTDARVLGITARINPMQADYQGLWRDQFMPREREIAAMASGPDYYGAYFPTDQHGMVDFVAGMLVAVDTQVPEGLVARDMPGGQYAAFSAVMNAIGPTWRAIYEEWLPKSAYKEDPARPCFEEFPADSTGPDSPLTIFLPIQPR